MEILKEMTVIKKIYCTTFFDFCCFLEIKNMAKAITKAAMAGKKARLDKGVAVSMAVNIAAIKPKIIKNVLIKLIF